MKDHQAHVFYLNEYQPPAWLVPHVRLLVQLYEEGARVTATLTCRRNPESPIRGPLVLNGVELELERIHLNGRVLDAGEFQVDGESLSCHPEGEDCELATTVWIKPQENTCLEGLYRSGGMFCTQCEAEGFRRITWFPDRPDVMSRFEVTVEAEQERYPVLLSNGNPIARGDMAAGRHWVTWQDPFPKPAYLFALVAGKLLPLTDHFVTASGRQVTLNLYVEPGNLGKCEHAMASLKRAMRWDEERYGREYDLDLFNIVAVSDFNMGAMENKGLNIFNSSCVLACPQSASDSAFERIESVVAHEYFHNWSGNRVTCRDWFQLSLKEGFTVFRDASYTADLYGEALKRIDDVTLLRTAQFAEDAGPMAHPVRPDSYQEISNFYTLTVYEKGAEVVRMSHCLLGETLFRKGCDLYFDRHDGQAVTTDDFVACMAEVSGRDLTQFKLWYSQAGTPRLTVRDHYDPATRLYTLNLTQHCPDTPGQSNKQPMLIPVDIALFDPKGQILEQSPGMVEFSDAETTLGFSDLAERPVPSLLRGFTAPVRLDYPWNCAQLALLMRHETDGFNRWDAAQALYLLTLEGLLAQEAVTLADCPAEMGSAWMSLLDEVDLDDAGLIERMIRLPTVAQLIERRDRVDLDALLDLRERLTGSLYLQGRDRLWQSYQMMQDAPAEMSPRAMGARALKNTCLAMLCCIDDQEALEAATKQQEQATLMTDEQGALAALLASHDRDRALAGLKRFAARWHEDDLVMNGWFALQAGAERFIDLAGVRDLAEHPLFDSRNPNKVRALLGTFAGQHFRGFHATDGSGYEFLQKWVQKLDSSNPQIAARLVIPLTRWRKFSDPRGERMRKALQKLQSGATLSSDLAEVVRKSLDGAA